MLAHTRPAQSDSEVSLIAARVHTTYMPTLGVPDSHMPYRAVSVWGVYKKQSAPRPALDLTSGPRAPERVVNAPADPIRLAVETPAAIPAARKSFLSQPVAMAVAASAGAILIAWLLFGYGRPAGSDAPSLAASQTTKPVPPVAIARPAPEPASAPVTLARISTATAVLSTPALASASPASSSSSSSSSAVSFVPTAPTKAPAMSSAAPIARVAETKASATSYAAPIAHGAVIAQTHSHKATQQATKHAVPVKHTAAKRKNSSVHAWAEPTRQGRNRHGKAAETLRPVRTVRATRAIDSRHSGDERVAAVESSWRARAASNYGNSYSSNYSSSHGNRIPTTKAPESLNPEALYAILQHSPTLDSNAPASGARTPRTGGASGN
ncbi:hypothetical protein BRPE64_ACDS20960 [Caballeronia insecticola]|uniref:Uncharacterized protein n=1 Tax=Caballeronia insecticola TaxID=758793 RepID=R4WSC9_9BURK|nr:hypothetical protein BRPE64_ACDS20960 [Caballeronia insecticola]